MFKLRNISIFVFSMWILVQFMLIVLNWNFVPESDFRAYQILAEKCIANNCWYPMPDNVYDNFIWAPGLINLLILQLKVFGGFHVNMFLNLFFNIGILCMIYKLATKFVNHVVGLISIILFCTFYSNCLIIIPTNTELPFLFFSLLGLCLCVKGRNWCYLAGLSFIVAETIRPLTIIFIITAIVLLLLLKEKKINIVKLVGAYAFGALLVGSICYARIGYFNYKSTTGGYNLIMVANDKSNDGFYPSIFKDSTSTAYIPGFQNVTELSYTLDNKQYTFEERDKKWTDESVKWILNNPIRYTKSIFPRLFALYDKDLVYDIYHSSNPLTDNILKIAKSIVYYIVLLFSIIGLFMVRNKYVYTLLLVTILGTCITILLPCADRYHYPLIFPLIILSSSSIYTLYQKRRNDY